MKFCKDCKWSKKGYRWPGFHYEAYFCHHPEHIIKYDLVDGTPEVSECERHRCDEKNWNGDLLSKCGEKGLLWEENSEETLLQPVRGGRIVEKIKNLFRRS